MPYFISDKNPECSGWAVEKSDGEVLGCHKTKADAIKQMVAVSIAEDMEPGGERALPDNYRPASSPDVPVNRNCGNCHYYVHGYCLKWEEPVQVQFYCNAWESITHEMDEEEPDEVDEDEAEDQTDTDDDQDYTGETLDPDLRQVDLTVPDYIRSAARRGLDMYAEGLAGDGLVARTVREARDMARGQITADKIIRANAWAQRHAVDLQAPKNSDPSNDQWPGPGAVAHFLWGINPTAPDQGRRWFARKAAAIKSERADAPAPAKDQIVGSEKNPAGSAAGPAGAGTIELGEAVETGLRNKVTDHNDSLDAGDPAWKRATVGMVRSVYRRGAGAFSTSHRPGMTRNQWSMARVNAFLVLLRRGRPENPAYTSDNDLLPKGHPRSSRND
jgi:hypothetical protein